MAISIDWGTRIISVPQADLTFLSGVNYSLNTETFRLALRDLEDSPEGIVFPKTHNHSTAVLLGGVSYARIIEIINGYTITFEETGTPYSVSLVGSNNNILAVTNLGTVQIASNNSGGLIGVTELTNTVYHLSFDSGIWIDQQGGYTAITVPEFELLGSSRYPAKDIGTAKAARDHHALPKHLYVIGNLDIGNSDNLQGWDVTGQNAFRTKVNVDDLANVTGTAFSEVTLHNSTLDGNSILRQSVLSDTTFVNGYVFQCYLVGTTVLGGAAQADFMNSYSGVAGTDTPTIDLGGSGQALTMRAYTGGILLINKTGADACSIDFISGQLKIDLTTVTNGTIVARGGGKVIDYATGDIMHSGTYGGLTLVNETINGEHLHDIHDAHFRRRVWSSVNNTITIYEEDGVTPKFVFDTNADLSDIDPQ